MATKLALTAQRVCGIIYVGICWIVITPLLLYYLHSYYKLYKTGKMGIRQKHVIIILVMEAAIILLVAVNRPIIVGMEFHELTNITLNHINRVFFVTALYAILTSFLHRIWILLYDTKLNQWQQNTAWKRVINAEKNNADWFRSNRRTFGSSRVIGLYLLLVWALNCGIHYALYMFAAPNSEAYFQSTATAVYALCIFVIYLKLPLLRDIFRLRDEIKVSLYMGSFTVVVFVLNTVWLRDAYWEYNYFEEVVYLVCCAGIGLMSTLFPIIILRHNAISEYDGNTIKVGHRLDKFTLRAFQKKQSLSKVSKQKLKIKISSYTPESDANDRNIELDVDTDSSAKHQSFVVGKFNFVLASEPQFELFMSHIKHEFSMENMLGLIEFCQFEDAIIEQMDQLDDRKTFFKKYDFIFYADIPKSQIVHDSKMDIWQKHVRLFEKYIKIGAEYELNLAYKIRTQNTKLCEDILSRSKDCNLNRVLDCVEDTLTSIRAILFDSFSRFDGTFNQPLQMKLQLSTMHSHELEQAP